MAFNPPALFNYLGFNKQGDLSGLTCYTSRRNQVVWFPKSPPLRPPSTEQIQQRNRFRLVAQLWRAQSQVARSNWRRAAKAAALRITGYNFFTYWQLSSDTSAVQTVERQTGINLLP